MEHDPRIAPFLTSEPNTFAKVTADSRWSRILVGVLKDVQLSTDVETDLAKKQEGSLLLGEIKDVLADIEGNQPLKPIPDDGRRDITSYNEELASRGEQRWKAMPWLYAECYFYRYLASIFFRSAHWQSYDVFGRQKLDSIAAAKTSIIELAKAYHSSIAHAQEGQVDQDASLEQIIFHDMFEACLWGNASDLSLLLDASPEQLRRLQGVAARKDSHSRIIRNQLPRVWDDLRQARATGRQRRVDIILDNAGFELINDLVLAGYLLHAGFATQVVLHTKDFPWFVSDAMPKDITLLLSTLGMSESYFWPDGISDADTQAITAMVADWNALFADGKLAYAENDFWTHSGSFWRMPFTHPDLFTSLCESELVIFKGDLNGRKLAGDARWEPTTSFEESLGPLTKGRMKLLLLRTTKSDVVIGLKEGQYEALQKTYEEEKGAELTEENRVWSWSGKWAFALYHHPLE